MPRAFLLAGSAFRCHEAFELDVAKEADAYSSSPEAIEMESARRLLWACYMLDAQIGSGVDKNLNWRDDAPPICLPAPEEAFACGTLPGKEEMATLASFTSLRSGFASTYEPTWSTSDGFGHKYSGKQASEHPERTLLSRCNYLTLAIAGRLNRVSESPVSLWDEIPLSAPFEIARILVWRFARRAPADRLEPLCPQRTKHPGRRLHASFCLSFRRCGLDKSLPARI